GVAFRRTLPQQSLFRSCSGNCCAVLGALVFEGLTTRLDPSNYNGLNRIRKLSKHYPVPHHRPCALGASYGVLVRTKPPSIARPVRHPYCVLFTQGRKSYC